MCLLSVHPVLVRLRVEVLHGDRCSGDGVTRKGVETPMSQRKFQWHLADGRHRHHAWRAHVSPNLGSQRKGGDHAAVFSVGARAMHPCLNGGEGLGVNPCFVRIWRNFVR